MDLLSIFASLAADSWQLWPARSRGRRFVVALLVLVVGYLVVRASL